MTSDPLEGLERRPQAAQLGILASVARAQNNAIRDVEEKLGAVQMALWGLLITLLVATIGIITTLVLTRPHA